MQPIGMEGSQSSIKEVASQIPYKESALWRTPNVCVGKKTKMCV